MDHIFQCNKFSAEVKIELKMQSELQSLPLLRAFQDNIFVVFYNGIFVLQSLPLLRAFQEEKGEGTAS